MDKCWRLNFQSVQNILKICSHFFLASLLSRLMNQAADDVINSLIFIIRHDHHNAKTKTRSLGWTLFFWLTNFICVLRSFGNDVGRKIWSSFIKPRRCSLPPFLYRIWECGVPCHGLSSLRERICWCKFLLQDEDRSRNSSRYPSDFPCQRYG